MQDILNGQMVDLLMGPNAILENLHAGRRALRRIYVLKGRGGERIREILRLADEREIPVSWMERNEIARVCKNDRHQGVAALTDAQRYFGLEDTLEENKRKGEVPFFLVLDGVQDSGNVGSLLRTAESAGIDAVIIPEHGSATLGYGAAKTSAGALEYVRVIKVPNLVRAISRLKDDGIWVVGADQDGERIYYDADLLGPLALVVGGEGKGLRRLTKEHCDLLVRIPLGGHISCLNAGVAAGIVIFEVLRQRNRKMDSKNEKRA